jgi:hypothetical protein
MHGLLGVRLQLGQHLQRFSLRECSPVTRNNTHALLGGGGYGGRFAHEIISLPAQCPWLERGKKEAKAIAEKTLHRAKTRISAWPPLGSGLSDYRATAFKEPRFGIPGVQLTTA